MHRVTRFPLCAVLAELGGACTAVPPEPELLAQVDEPEPGLSWRSVTRPDAHPYRGVHESPEATRLRTQLCDALSRRDCADLASRPRLGPDLPASTLLAPRKPEWASLWALDMLKRPPIPSYTDVRCLGGPVDLPNPCVLDCETAYPGLACDPTWTEESVRAVEERLHAHIDTLDLSRWDRSFLHGARVYIPTRRLEGDGFFIVFGGRGSGRSGGIPWRPIHHFGPVWSVQYTHTTGKFTHLVRWW